MAPGVPLLAAKVRPPVRRGLPRPRLLLALDAVWSRGLGLVVAPAGSGKTTLLSHFAAAHEGSVAWYQAEASESTPAELLAYLRRALSEGCGLRTPPWTSVDDALVQLEHTLDRPVLLVVDDVHTLAGSASEQALSRLLAYLPPTLRVLLGSRRPPALDLTRRRLDDGIVEIGANDLRFRTWETEQLFNEEYRERLAPEELAELTRRTEGWAAGLQFFHLATRAKPAAERVRVLTALGRRSGMVHDYLARNVLAELPDELARFMVRTSPLGWMTGPICDAFLGSVGADRLLGAAEERHVFTEQLDGGAYRYHEVIRAHLEDALVDLLGDQGARAEHRRAAALLEDAHRPVEAARAWSRAGEWTEAARLLGQDGGGDEAAIPNALASEPWALLAAARRLVRQGRLDAALDAYQAAERAAGRSQRAEVCRTERAATAAWCLAAPSPGGGWSSILRRATMRQPRRVFDEVVPDRDAMGRLTAGLMLLLAGELASARAAFEDLSQDPDVPTPTAAGAQVAAALVALMTGDEVVGLAWAVEALEADFGWIAQLGSALALTGEPASLAEAAAVRARCLRDGNRWGEAIAALLEGLLWLRLDVGPGTPPAPTAAADRCVELLAEAGAAVLHAWALGVRARLRTETGDPDASEAVLAALRGGSAAGTDLVRHLCEAVPDALASADAPPVVIRCFGGFAIEVGGVVVDDRPAKPRVRSLLRLLAANVGRTVHRDVLVDALWPDQSVAGATRSLQVAVSLVRQLLPSGSRLVVRAGEGYLLCMPPGSWADVCEFAIAVGRGRRALRSGALDEARDALVAALDLYTGDLLPEEGAADWAVKERDRLAAEAADAAGCLGETLLEVGDGRGALAAFERAVRIDPYRDGMWRLLIRTARDQGDLAAAQHAQRGYEAVLTALDVPVDLVLPVRR